MQINWILLLTIAAVTVVVAIANLLTSVIKIREKIKDSKKKFDAYWKTHTMILRSKTFFFYFFHLILCLSLRAISKEMKSYSICAMTCALTEQYKQNSKEKKTASKLCKNVDQIVTIRNWRVNAWFHWELFVVDVVVHIQMRNK